MPVDNYEPYAFWHNAFDHPDQEVDQNSPEPGFWRMKDGTPVAIWFDGDDQLLVMTGAETMIDPAGFEDIWTRCATRPVTEEQYQEYFVNGRWHDVDDLVVETLGDNIKDATDPATIKDLLAILQKAADKYTAKGAIASDDDIAKAQTVRTRMLELKGRADKLREAEKAPHLKASRDVDAVWMPTVKAADESTTKLRRAMEAYETAKLMARRKAEAEALAAAEAARKAAEETGWPSPVDMSGPDRPEPEAPVKTTIKGGYGRAASVGTRRVVTKITDPAKLFDYYMDGMSGERAQLLELLTKLAQADIGRGFVFPAGLIEIEERATLS